ncbi:DUF2442 domain-containing protein [Candidatus Magnetomonas plexicatena]|uniref:DUF2442 domain-containing protein n=1 Tax=Candidatus Magnetomonas plexicatena TaxID=2552947 RepID=UPI0011036004|nr:DUF2442 domain-containing protein [Nitrospirales bacterium LBB_01]
MNPRVKEVYSNNDYTLRIIFDNGEVGIFDVTPYLDKGIFKQLRDRSMFNSAKVFLGTVQWVNGLDFCPDTIYLESKKHLD